MAWVHGNEKSGQIILDGLKDTLSVTSGKVYIIPFANPQAIWKNIRQTEKNMNRSFCENPPWNTYEDVRARQILPILKESEYLLDIHNTLSTENSIPFLISEHPEWNIYFPVDRIIRGLDILHPGGSDGYMNSIGKIGLCIESGSIYDPNWPEIAKNSVINFLRATGNIAGTPKLYKNQQKYCLDTIIKSKTSQFEFVKRWSDFEEICMGELIAKDGNHDIIAPYNGIILFSYASKNIGDEVCVFGKIIK